MMVGIAAVALARSQGRLSDRKARDSVQGNTKERVPGGFNPMLRDLNFDIMTSWYGLPTLLIFLSPARINFTHGDGAPP